MASATGESRNASQFSCDAAKTSTAAESTTKTATKVFDNVPAGIDRMEVRGLAASYSASTKRLKAIAAERAPTIATTIQRSWRADGKPLAASMAPQSANGSAKIECSHLIISSVVLVFARTRTTRL